MRDFIGKLFFRNYQDKNLIIFKNITVKKFSVLYIGLENIIITSNNRKNIDAAYELLIELNRQKDHIKF